MLIVLGLVANDQGSLDAAEEAELDPEARRVCNERIQDILAEIELSGGAEEAVNFRAATNELDADAQAIETARRARLDLTAQEEHELSVYEFHLQRRAPLADAEPTRPFADSCPAHWNKAALAGVFEHLEGMSLEELRSAAQGSRRLDDIGKMHKLEQAQRAESQLHGEIAGRRELRKLLRECQWQIDGPISRKAALMSALGEILQFRLDGVDAKDVARVRPPREFDREAVRAARVLDLHLDAHQLAYLEAFVGG